MKLYQLATQYQESIASLQSMLESGEIDEQTFADTAESIQGEVKDKAINVALHIKNLMAEIDGIKAAEASFKERRQRAEKSLDFFMAYLANNLQKAKITELKTDLVALKYKKLPAVVNVTGEVDTMPLEYVRVIPESIEPDKKAIAEALKKGEQLDFATLITGRTKLVVE